MRVSLPQQKPRAWQRICGRVPGIRRAVFRRESLGAGGVRPDPIRPRSNAKHTLKPPQSNRKRGYSPQRAIAGARICGRIRGRDLNGRRLVGAHSYCHSGCPAGGASGFTRQRDETSCKHTLSPPRRSRGWSCRRDPHSTDSGSSGAMLARRGPGREPRHYPGCETPFRRVGERGSGSREGSSGSRERRDAGSGDCWQSARIR